MEKGIPMAAVQSLPGYAGMNDGIPVQPTQAAPSAPEKKPEKAAPEDLQRIKENWKNIVMQTQGMFKTFLTTAVPKYNGNTGENKLYVEFSNDLAQTCVDDPDKKPAAGRSDFTDDGKNRGSGDAFKENKYASGLGRNLG